MEIGDQINTGESPFLGVKSEVRVTGEVVRIDE
jgi:hypothetical protein